MIMEYLFVLVGLLIGLVVAWLIFRNKIQQQKISSVSEKSEMQNELGVLRERLNLIQQDKDELQLKIDQVTKENQELNRNMVRKDEQNHHLNKRLEEQKIEMEDLQKRFKDEFENLANKILEEKSKKFTEQNKLNLDLLLSPLKEKIILFEKRVEDTYEKGLKDQTDLKAEIKTLHELNVRISDEARDLTNALKGDMKKQGNWGEIILERVLERSGLTKGVEYEVQVTTRSEEGELMRPDVIIRLPENKHIIIDSKVSLIAYELFINADTPEKKEKQLKLHVESIKNHVKILSEKNYQIKEDFDTPDFVLLFMPVESAFSAAVQADIELFNYAWSRKIVIVSPTTLLATLRTVESIWRQEKQTQNAIEIARQGGNLYDKFVAFLSDLEKLGNQINTVSKTYDETHKKLTSGRGDLITRAKKLKDLGAKASKSLPEKYDHDEDNLLNEL